MAAGPAPDLLLTAEADVSAPRKVRAAFAHAFPQLRRLDDAVLCVSEAVTNAVLHAGTRIEVTAIRLGDVVRVEIWDGSLALPVRRVLERTSTTGRGVHLLDQLTARWGVELGDDGKTVWLEFELSGEP